MELDLIDGIVPEPEGGAHEDHEGAARLLDPLLLLAVEQLSSIPVTELLDKRYQRFRNMGRFFTPPAS